MTGDIQKNIALASSQDFGDWAEGKVLEAFKARYPGLIWMNLNRVEPNAPFDLMGCWPSTGEVCWLVEVKGTDFHGSSPGITMCKSAKARKLAYAKIHDARPIMACYDWQSEEILARTGIACFHVSEMQPLARLPNIFEPIQE